MLGDDYEDSMEDGTTLRMMVVETLVIATADGTADRVEEGTTDGERDGAPDGAVDRTANIAGDGTAHTIRVWCRGQRMRHN